MRQLSLPLPLGLGRLDIERVLGAIVQLVEILALALLELADLRVLKPCSDINRTSEWRLYIQWWQFLAAL